MITNSQVSLVAETAAQLRSRGSTDLQVTSPRPGPAVRTGDDNNRGSQWVAEREAFYRYTASSQTAFSHSGEVQAGDGSHHYSSTQHAEHAAELVLSGQQAISVSRAALGDGAGVTGSAGLSLSLSRYQFHSLSESRLLTSGGSLTLDDGTTVNFTLALRQQQTHRYEYSEQLQISERPLTDPLVINFGAATARLTDSLFEFDLTGNGETGSFATLGAGSGYLVLDRNGNGRVDDGSELFGPRHGSGFAELAAFDDDGNRWIDDGDAVFDSLQVWVQTGDGGQALRSLADVGVQALYVDSATDHFTLTGAQGVPLGQIRASGLYLTSGGEVRTLEEVELADQQLDAAPPEALETIVGGIQPGVPGGGDSEGRNERLAAIRTALDKLQEIREKQQAFIDQSRSEAPPQSALEGYLRRVDQLRLALLVSQDEKSQAASRYRELSRL